MEGLHVKSVGLQEPGKLLQDGKHSELTIVNLSQYAAKSMCLVGLLGRIYRIHKPSCFSG